MAEARLAVGILLFLILEVEVFNGPLMARVEAIDCPLNCNKRCSKAGWQKMCIRTCNTCCQRCNCVPPGTFGNKEACPCYAQMRTHGGRFKCP